MPSAIVVRPLDDHELPEPLAGEVDRLGMAAGSDHG
jgi:hypothetical protein